MEVVLFRPTQRQAWVDRLQSSGCTIRFVHDSNRLLPSTDVVIIDSKVAKWKDYIRLLKDIGIPLLLLVDETFTIHPDDPIAGEVWGAITTEDDIQQLFVQMNSRHPDDTNTIEASNAPISSRQKAQTKDEQEQMFQTVTEERADELREDLPLGKSAPCVKGEYVPLSRRKNQGPPPVPPNLTLVEKSGPDRMDYQRAADPQLGKKPATHAAPQMQQSQVQETRASATQDSNPMRVDEANIVPPKSLLVAAERRELPSIVSIYAPKGGVGKTVFLVHLAALLALEKCRVCVVDLDLSQGTLAATLQLSPDKTILDLIHRIESPKASRACLLQTKMGFFVVAAPEHSVEITLLEDQLRAMLTFLKSEMDVVLVDTSSHLDSVTKVAMTESDVLLLMTTADPASIASLIRMRPLLASLLPSPEIGVIWNRLIQAGHPPTLPWLRLLELPEETSVAAAVRKGGANLHGPYASAIQSLIRKWLGKESAETVKRKKPWIRWLFRIP